MNSPGGSPGNSPGEEGGGGTSQQQPESAGEGGDSPHEPTPAAQATGAADAGAGGPGGSPSRRDRESVRPSTDQEQSKTRKRARSDDPGASSSVSKPKFDAPDVASPCSVCGKQFASWKALFGHMRSHPERQWRGVHPPPTFHREGSPERINVEQQAHQGGEHAGAGGDHEVASYLLKLATQVKNTLEKQQHSRSGTVDESGPSGLNKDTAVREDEPLSTQGQGQGLEPSSSSPPRRGLNFDLNLPQEQNPSSPSPERQPFHIDLNFPAPPESDDDE